MKIIKPNKTGQCGDSAPYPARICAKRFYVETVLGKALQQCSSWPAATEGEGTDRDVSQRRLVYARPNRTLKQLCKDLVRGIEQRWGVKPKYMGFIHKQHFLEPTKMVRDLSIIEDGTVFVVCRFYEAPQSDIACKLIKCYDD